ncbi:GATOR complex protein wdr59 [Bulinus truncatus]|nr:GATOR complex protein wdr59 [Bulinus truncatus]
MTGRYGTEFLAAEVKDVQASAMAVDCVGQWTLLAGRKNLVFVDLNRPLQTTVKVTRQSKWSISCVQWNCHASHAYRFVVACNQRLDLFDFHEAAAVHLCSLKAHSRTISAVDWSPFDVNVVASCSLDTFTYFWDVRDSKKPVKTFQTVTGVYQVKWNKVTNNLFATTHDGDVRIWDPRKGNTPVQYISAHPSKIHGLDWSNVEQHKLVTASQDCTIRVWDYNNPRRCEAMINSGNPVWRARYTPFGEGVVSVVVPQLRRVENNLYLWNIKNQQSPVHTFIGHKDVILEFQWRKQQEGSRDHQLVTWSKDQTLRIWKVDTSMQKLCGYDIDDNGDSILEQDFSVSHNNFVPDLNKKSELLSANNRILTAAKSDVSGGNAAASNSNSHLSMMSRMLSAMSLEDECREIGQIPGVKLEQADMDKRVLTLKLTKEQNYVDIHISFPDKYPIRVIPHMSILHTNLDSETQQRIVKLFNETSSLHVKKHANCIKLCVKQIFNVMENSGVPAVNQENVSLGEDRKSMLDKKFLVEKVIPPTSPVVQSSVVPMYPTGSFQDSCIPFPRTCGATFCSNDFLVIFNVPAALKKVSEDSESTPRALSELASYSHTQPQWMRNQSNSFVSSLFFSSPPEGLSVSSFYTEKATKNRHHRSSHKSRSKDREGRHDKERESDRASKRMHKVGCIKIYDISSMNNISKYLAQHYKLDLEDLHGTCKHNAEVASKIRRHDLTQLWRIVDHLTNESLKPSLNLEERAPWACRPCGRPLLKKMFDHYSKCRDVQTLAMLSCVFWDKEKPKRDVLSFISTSSQNRNDSQSTAANVPEITLASSSDSGWNLLLNKTGSNAAALLPHAQKQTSPSPVLSPVHPLPPSSSPSSSSSSAIRGKGGRTMAEVASQPNLAVLFRAGRSKAGRSTAVMKSKRSFSWSESYEEFKVSEEKDPKEKELERERHQYSNSCKLLDPDQTAHFEQIKKVYANILFKWGLLIERAHILKHTDGCGVEHQTIGCPVTCFNCSESVRDVQCHVCKYPALRCSVCNMSVRGLSEVCLACGHGGHIIHMMEWFTQQSVCPSGCGCKCLQENSLRNSITQDGAL